MMATVDSIPGYGAPAPRSLRRPCLPALESLTYAKELMTVGLLLLAFVWLLPRLVMRPGATLEAVGKRAVGSRV